jgi:hypothetical protein
MRLPWRRQKAADSHPDPNRPHPYRPGSDAGIGALAPLGGGVGQQVADIAAASAYTRTIGCAVPGCGKPRDALVHAPEE